MSKLKDATMIDATEERKNRFNGESYLLTPHEAKIHDDIFIDELAATLEDKEVGIDGHYYFNNSDKYFCSQRCKFDWLSLNMENIEQGRPIEFIRHRRESGGYEKITEETHWGNRTTIERVDNRTEIE